MDASQLPALKTELTTDHVAVARLVNKPGRSIDRDTLSAKALVGCLDKTEFTALPAPDKAWLNLFVTAGEVEMTQDVRVALRSLFPAGSKTRQGINRATTRDASRAEELGFGRVTESDVADALRV